MVGDVLPRGFGLEVREEPVVFVYALVLFQVCSEIFEVLIVTYVEAKGEGGIDLSNIQFTHQVGMVAQVAMTERFIISRGAGQGISDLMRI